MNLDNEKHGLNRDAKIFINENLCRPLKLPYENPPLQSSPSIPKQKNLVLICGDFNINLVKYDEDIAVQEFYNPISFKKLATYLKNRIPLDFIIAHTSDDEILKIILSLDESKSTGPSSIVKYC